MQAAEPIIQDQNATHNRAGMTILLRIGQMTKLSAK